MRFVAFASLLLLQCGCGTKPFRFTIAFEKAPGLKPGNEVRYLGLKVGEVERVYIAQGRGASKPEVAVEVVLPNRNIKIRHDDHFGINTEGLLGDEFVDVTPGDASSAQISEGSMVQGEISSLDLQKIPILRDAYHLALRLNSLPKGKQEDLLKKFDKLLDEAGGENPAASKP